MVLIAGAEEIEPALRDHWQDVTDGASPTRTRGAFTWTSPSRSPSGRRFA